MAATENSFAAALESKFDPEKIVATCKNPQVKHTVFLKKVG
jgi:hypothetical protein